MASGGGSHPSHLPITTPSSRSQTQHSLRGSLQTPDASALFVSSLEGGEDGGSDNNFAPSSPLDRFQSFTSLEELLTVTGINSLELDLPNKVRKLTEHDGVDSLQQIAKEVENSGGLY